MKEGVTMTCVFDCCHSGTVLDLPFVFKADGNQHDIAAKEDYNFDKIVEEAVLIEEDEADNGEEETETEPEESLYSALEEQEEEEEEDQPPSIPASEPSTNNNACDSDDDDDDSDAPQPRGEMTEVYIRYNKEQFTVKADLDDKIIKIKKALEKLTGLPVENQLLIYNGFKRPFKDEQTLRYYRCLQGANFTLQEK